MAALGVVVSLVGTTEPDLVEDDLVNRDEYAGVAGDRTTTDSAVVAEPQQRRDRQRPTLSGLSARVEQLLQLAAEQADDHRTEARREAAGIVTAARREVEAIQNRAHEQASGITDTRPDLSPPPTRALSRNEDPNPRL